MDIYKVPLSDFLAVQVVESMKKFAGKLQQTEIQDMFLMFADALLASGRLHFVDVPDNTEDVVMGLDGAFATYRIFGGIIAIFVTLGAVISDGELEVIPLLSGADVYMGDLGVRTFKIKEYIAELSSIRKASLLLQEKGISDAVIFVDGSLSSSIGHVRMQRDIPSDIIDDLMDTVQSALDVPHDVVFVPKRMLMEIAWNDSVVKRHSRIGDVDLIDKFRQMGMVEGFVIGNAIVSKRQSLLDAHDIKGTKVAIVGPFYLPIDISHPADESKRVHVPMNTYYINYLPWKHVVLRVDVATDKDIEWIKRHVLPAIDVNARMSCIVAADEYAKRTISSAMSNVIVNVFQSDEVKDIIKFFPNYRADTFHESAISYGE